jgi:hypothetical protein
MNPSPRPRSGVRRSPPYPPAMSFSGGGGDEDCDRGKRGSRGARVRVRTQTLGNVWKRSIFVRNTWSAVRRMIGPDVAPRQSPEGARSKQGIIETCSGIPAAGVEGRCGEQEGSKPHTPNPLMMSCRTPPSARVDPDRPDSNQSARARPSSWRTLPTVSRS